MSKKNNQEKPNIIKRFIAFIRRFMSSFTVKYSARPVLMTVAFLVFANLTVLLVAAGIAMHLSDEFANYIEALVAAGTWLVAPNSVLAHENFSMQILNLVVLLIGMVLFTGTTIAIITTYFRNFVNRKNEAKGLLLLSDHIIILNFNNKVSAMLIDLMYSKCTKTVMILSDKTKEFIRENLATELASLAKQKPKTKLKLIVRKGNPESISELEEIGLKDASGILIVESNSDNSNKENHYSNRITNGYPTIKLVMKLANFNISPACPIAIEADDYNTVNIIRGLNKNVPGLQTKKLQSFSYNKKLGQFLALSILCPPLSSVLTGLLSNTGCTFTTTEYDFESYLKTHKAGIPIIKLNKTYVLAPTEMQSHKKRLVDYNTKRLLEPSKLPKDYSILKLFIIGKNKKMDYMLSSLASENCPIEIKQFESNEFKEFVSAVLANNDKNTVALILSNDTVPVNEYDANVFLTLVEFSSKLNLPTRKFKIIAELLEPNNQKAVQEFSVHNIIISTRIISFLATKLISDPKAEYFYQEVFTHSKAKDEIKFDIWLDSAECLFDFDNAETLVFISYTEFIHSAYYGTNKRIMPLGRIGKEEKIEYFCYNMDTTSLSLNAKDTIVYVEHINIKK
ncbi:MAG: hypothetical protein FWE13_00940 [Firmicutes bacterium]|nr:hypothetical protein [Bacillota bacterium]